MKTFLIVLVLLATLLLIVFIYFDGFRKVKVTITKDGGEALVYEEFIGDYKLCGKVMDKIYYSLLEEHKIETFKGFGIYYDNPQKVEKSKLRSEVGCVLEDTSEEVIERLAGKYNIKLFPSKDFMLAEFPYKGKLSVMMGIMKVYPAINKFAKENGFDEDGWVMEIYDIPGKKISYRRELINK
jgi:hypothetical protein